MNKSTSSLCSLIHKLCPCCIHKATDADYKLDEDEGEFSPYYKDMLVSGKMKKVTSVGPWGGNKGGNWTFNEDGSENIKQIVLVHGDGIDSLVFRYEDDDGKMRSSSRFGGPGGLHTEKIDIDWPQEYITAICGYYGSMWWSGPVAVRSLTFVTNLNTYGPFGREEGSYFELPAQGGMIVGFHGRCNQFFNAIGIYTKPT